MRKAGVYGSIQDQGRTGYRRFGVPVSGAMDFHAYKMGNYILGNDFNDPALEFFLGGLELEVLTDHRIVITGADLGGLLDSEPTPYWKSFNIFKGQILKLTQPIRGTITYIIPEGGFYAEELLGSASTYPKGQLGTQLKKDMILYASKEKTNRFQSSLRPSDIPAYSKELCVRVWPSPHLNRFREESVYEFFKSTYCIKVGDRMGYLLEGPPLSFINGSDILSEATQFGTIQVPNNGQPIILMADAQTIGGYSTIGKIVKKDLWKVVQLRRGCKIKFEMLE
ncbi:biotin-dependent carboxyltransferase family protein [Bacillus sp. JJ1773]|uniref:5-oxoprolinase subunit C family protein n=1 Tax=Bacillus sp. JJ1773 TaxID=3122965 RepID=UPI0030000FE5